jgi:hypothetical protein
MQKTYKPEELTPTALQVKLAAHIVRDMKTMEANTKTPVDQLVETALKMFIATHSDYLGLRK